MMNSPRLSTGVRAFFSDMLHFSEFAYLEKENRPGDDDEFGLLLDFGVGLRFPIEERLSVSSTMIFNVVPGEVMDERFFFNWQVAQVEIHF